MNKRTIKRFPVALLVFVALPLAGSLIYASEGKIPLWEPTTIMAPGNYIVTRDISTAAGPALDILTENVTVDLNGFTLRTADPTAPVVRFAPEPTEPSHDENAFHLFDGALFGGTYGLLVLNDGLRNVRLHRLQIGGSTEAAVKVENVGSFEARGIVVIDTKIGFDLLSQVPDAVRTARISESSIQADVGIQCTGLTCDIRKNSIVSCSMGIRVNDALLGGTASQNSINVPGSNCFFNPQPEPPAIGVTNSPGYTATHNRINAELIAAGINHGIQIGMGSNDAFLMDNEITGFSGNGIQVMANDALIFGNQVNRNGGHGLAIGGENNLMDRNRTAANGGDGLNVSTAGQIYRNNVLLGNDASLGGAGAADIVDGGGNVE